ncbi:HpcH/HpaI aldolase family protein [Halorarum salinum]|uniref:Aldolase n=1 Tax=Halorarum salinum TaxID=2743089 RepID=A0A7D5L9J9_9EURY|nr:aldolase/citrate lyase family protein [Halobaculum salinum]QLG61151.1 aldolase [Halobaculum salinum]
MSGDHLRGQLHDGETALGTLQIFDSPQVAESIGVAGMDFVVFDQEHGPLTAETTLPLTMAAERGGAAPLVRVRRNSPAEIQRALDVGAGVQIPQIESASDAERAVSAARFDPVGSRGLSQYVRAGGYVGGPEYTDRQNEEQPVVLQVEGERGVENVDEILAVDGFDVLFLGPYDLSQSFGVPGEIRHERVQEAMKHVVERAEATGTVVGAFADDVGIARELVDLGVQYVMLSVDAPIFVDAVRDSVAEITR